MAISGSIPTFEAFVEWLPRLSNLAVVLMGLAGLLSFRRTLRQPRSPRFGHFAATDRLFQALRWSFIAWAIEIGLLLGLSQAVAESLAVRSLIYALEAVAVVSAFRGISQYWHRLRCPYSIFQRALLGSAILACPVALALLFVASPPASTPSDKVLIVQLGELPTAWISCAFFVALGMFCHSAYTRLDHRGPANVLLSFMIVYGVVQLLQAIRPADELLRSKFTTSLLVPSIFLKGVLFTGLIAMGYVGHLTVKFARSVGITAVIVDSEDKAISWPQSSHLPPVSLLRHGTILATVFQPEDRDRYLRWRGSLDQHKPRDATFRLATGDFARVEVIQADRKGAASSGGAARLLARDEAIIVFHLQDPEYMNAAISLWTHMEHMLRGNLGHVSSLLTEREGENSPHVATCRHLVLEIYEQIRLLEFIYGNLGYANNTVPVVVVDLVKLIDEELSRWRRVLATDAPRYNVSLKTRLDPDTDVSRLIQFSSSMPRLDYAVPVVVLRTALRELLLNSLRHRSHGPVLVKLEAARKGVVMRVSNSVRPEDGAEISKRLDTSKGGVDLVRRALGFCGAKLKYKYSAETSRLTAVWKMGEVTVDEDSDSG